MKVGPIIVYMNENFVHQLHLSVYSSQRDKEGVEHDGFGRTSGKGRRVSRTYAITKYGTLVTSDIDGFRIPEGPSKAQGKCLGA